MYTYINRVLNSSHYITHSVGRKINETRNLLAVKLSRLEHSYGKFRVLLLFSFFGLLSGTHGADNGYARISWPVTGLRTTTRTSRLNHRPHVCFLLLFYYFYHIITVQRLYYDLQWCYYTHAVRSTPGTSTSDAAATVVAPRTYGNCQGRSCVL